MARREEFLCGVIEGYYGRPWSFEQRERLFHYSSRFGLNTYVYAPKDDAKHRARWRDLYIDEESKQLKELIQRCRKNKLNFVYALSPGLDVKYSSDEDFEYLQKKFEQIASFGCEHWALLFDDIESEMSPEDQKVFSSFAEAQVSISNRLFDALQQPSTFLFCPTEYCSRMARPSLEASPYLQTIGDGLHSKISIFWTGPKVVSRRITSGHLHDVQRVLKRRVTIWENLNANDYDQRRLCLGPLTGRSTDLIEELNGFLINPNCEFEVNFVPINTLGQWFRSTKDNPYRVDKALTQALIDWQEEELNGLSIEDARLLVDFFYLPYENGREAQRLFNECYWLRWNVEKKNDVDEWKQRSLAYQQRVKEIGRFYERLIQMSNRALLYDLYGYIQDLNSCISLSSQYLRWIDQRQPSSIFMSGDVEPWAIRGALAGDFLNLLPLGHSQSLISNSATIFFVRPIGDDQEKLKDLSIVDDFDRGYLAETSEDKPCAAIVWSVVKETSIEHPVRVELAVDFTMKTEEIFQITSKLFSMVTKELRRQHRGCHALINDEDVLLHQCYSRLGFIDIPTIEETKIVLSKEF